MGALLRLCQENVILLAEKEAQPHDVLLTASHGRTFDCVDRQLLPYRKVVEGGSGDHLIRVAASELERRIVEAVDGLPHRGKSATPLPIAATPRPRLSKE